MAENDVNEGPTQTVNDGGYITVWKDTGGVLGWRKIPCSDIAAINTLAEAALPASAATSIVAEDPEAYVRTAEFAATVANLNAQIAALAERITSLETLVGASQIRVLEDGILEPGIVV